MTAVRQLALAQKQSLNECSGEASSCRAGDGVWLQAYQRCAERPRVVNDARNSSHCTVFCRPHLTTRRAAHPARDRPALSASRARAPLGRMHTSETTFGFAGFYTATYRVACFMHLAVDWSRESSCWHRSQIPTSVDGLFYTNNLSQKVLDGRAAAASCSSATDGRSVRHGHRRYQPVARAINSDQREPVSSEEQECRWPPGAPQSSMLTA